MSNIGNNLDTIGKGTKVLGMYDAVSYTEPAFYWC